MLMPNYNTQQLRTTLGLGTNELALGITISSLTPQGYEAIRQRNNNRHPDERANISALSITGGHVAALLVGFSQFNKSRVYTIQD
jgi:hypothetical protein